MPHWLPKFPIETILLAKNLFRISTTFGQRLGHKQQMHSYYLIRPDGNILFHGPDQVSAYRSLQPFFEKHGGIAFQAMTHAGDACKDMAYVQETWGAPVYVSKNDLNHLMHKSKLSSAKTFVPGEPLFQGVGTIPIPGHTPGHTAFRFKIGEAYYLVTNHVFRQMPTPGKWGVGLHPLMLQTYMKTLRNIQNLETDFLLLDKTHQEPVPPIPFGPSERRAITENVCQTLAKKFKIPDLIL